MAILPTCRQRHLWDYGRSLMDPYGFQKSFLVRDGHWQTEPSMATNIINWVLVTPCSIPLHKVPWLKGVKSLMVSGSFLLCFLLRTEYSGRYSYSHCTTGKQRLNNLLCFSKVKLLAYIIYSLMELEFSSRFLKSENTCYFCLLQDLWRCSSE